MNRFFAFVGLCVLIGGVAASGDGEAFWEEREEAYRSNPRGPFTAFRAEYLAPGDTLALYASRDGVGVEPGGDAGIRIVFDENGFLVAPAGPGAPSRAGEPLRGAKRLADPGKEDFALGRFLLSFGLQAEDLGRVLVYDPRRVERFHGFPVFEDSDAFRIDARLSPLDGDTLNLGTTRGLEKPFVRSARIEFELAGETCRLTGFRSAGESEGPLFVPFTDRTTGEESYAVGRYLRVVPDEGAATATVDFNRATNPWCAYSPFYNCVLPPEENRLPVPIRAGERAPKDH